jgi:hypothetical protein
VVQRLAGPGSLRSVRSDSLTVPVLISVVGLAVLCMLTIRRVAATSGLSVRHPEQGPLWSGALWLPMVLAALGGLAAVWTVVRRTPVVSIGAALIVVVALAVDRRRSQAAWSSAKVLSRVSQSWRRDRRVLGLFVIVAAGFGAAGAGFVLWSLVGISARQRVVATVVAMAGVIVMSVLGRSIADARSGGAGGATSAKSLAASLGGLPATSAEGALRVDTKAGWLDRWQVHFAAGGLVGLLVAAGETRRSLGAVGLREVAGGLLCALICGVSGGVLKAVRTQSEK